jgi:two-component system sensor histidine kinase BarA
VSYRGVKRVLGETNLERKCRWLFGMCLVVLIAGSFWWYGARTERLVYDNTRVAAAALVEPVLLKVHNKFFEGPENKKLIEGWEQLWQSKEGYEGAVINPANPKPERQPKTPLDERVFAEFRAMQPFHEPDDESASSRGEQHRDDRDEASGEYYYYRPIWAQDGNCINCHISMGASGQALIGAGAPGDRVLQMGDLLGVVKITVPDTATRVAINKNRAILIATAIVTVFLAMLAAYIIVRYVIVKPLKHLRDVSDEVTRGNVQARAVIETGDEFEDLSKAFNKMLRHLTDIQAELQLANTSLDGKVDELAQLNMRLYEMNRLKSDFLATMSHELRTPLNSIIGFSDVLCSIKSLDDKQRRYVQNIQKSGRLLLEMINDILDLAKIESGKMEVRLSEFHIEHVIAAQCDMARPLAERKNIDLDCDMEASLPELFQDQGKVQQILNNLLSNAIKFTPEGGRILVSAKRNQQGDLLISVADTGVGIAEADQTAIFEKFRQGTAVLSGGDAMTREHSGTGLGLSIVKELCKLLGGEIYLESQLGKGSTFTVQLPFTRADQPKFDSPLDQNLDELIRPRREELQRALSE